MRKARPSVLNLCLALLLAFTAESSHAATDPCTLPVDASARYLNNSAACGKSCSDSNAGTFDAPWCTFSAAMAKTPSAGVLKVLPGIYRASATVNRSSSITIRGLGDLGGVVFTPAKAIDESLFVSDGNGIYSATLSALGLGSSSDLSVMVLDQGKKLYKDSAMGCTYSFDVTGGRLRVRLDGNALPSAHTLEVVDNSQFTNGLLFPWVTGTGSDLDVENVVFRGMGTGIYMYKVATLLRFDHVRFEMASGPQIAIYYSGGTVNLSNIEVTGSHNLSYWATPGSLFTAYNRDTASRVSTYNVTATKIYAHNALGSFNLSVAGSRATVDGVEVYSAGVDHTGISLGSGGPGLLEVKNSVFASFDYTIDMRKPYACFFNKAYEDAAHDFLYSDGGAQVNATLENNLIAYGLFSIQFQGPPSGSHIKAINNIFINNSAIIGGSFAIDEWDYNLYYNASDPYSSAILNLPSGSLATLSAARSGWQSNFNCSGCDSHSLQTAPGLIDWARDDMFNYNFRPVQGSNVCGAGKNGADIGPYKCATSNSAPAAPSGLRLQ
ncbi:MAG: hypothetical protein K1X83_12650 [Oligoflexia bacterium]|nr:hypothetical protein [Oligoflexia bacterium]